MLLMLFNPRHIARIVSHAIISTLKLTNTLFSVAKGLFVVVVVVEEEMLNAFILINSKRSPSMISAFSSLDKRQNKVVDKSV